MIGDQRPTSHPPHHRFNRGLIGLAGTAVGTLLLIWVVAVPMDPVCPAIGGSGELPPCTAADRIAAGVRWSLVIAGCYVLATAVLLLGRRRPRVIVPAAVVAFAALCAVALGQVASSTGSRFPGGEDCGRARPARITPACPSAAGTA